MIPRTEKRTALRDGTAIVLRPFEACDAPAVFAAVRESLPQMSPWMGWCHAGYSLVESRIRAESREAMWAKGREFDFLIVEAATGLVLGACGLNHLVREHRLANLGYWVRTSWTRRGVASTAARRLAEFGFCEVGLQRIEIVAAVGNVASQRVAEKAGAMREGVLRSRLTVRGQVQDAVMFSLTPADLK